MVGDIKTVWAKTNWKKITQLLKLGLKIDLYVKTLLQLHVFFSWLISAVTSKGVRIMNKTGCKLSALFFPKSVNV